MRGTIGIMLPSLQTSHSLFNAHCLCMVAGAQVDTVSINMGDQFQFVYLLDGRFLCVETSTLHRCTEYHRWTPMQMYIAHCMYGLCQGCSYPYALQSHLGTAGPASKLRCSIQGVYRRVSWVQQDALSAPLPLRWSCCGRPDLLV